jgi:hypothetical protein
MKAVVECLPAFFPTDVRFVSVEYSDLTLLQLMTNTLHALPVLQVTTRGKRYRYRGRHKLGPLVAFLAQALVSLIRSANTVQITKLIAVFDRSTLLSLNHRPSTHPPTRQAREPLAPAEAAEACAHDASARGGWRCERTDGEATAEELTGQPSPLLYLSTAFLVRAGRVLSSDFLFCFGWLPSRFDTTPFLLPTPTAGGPRLRVVLEAAAAAGGGEAACCSGARCCSCAGAAAGRLGLDKTR